MKKNLSIKLITLAVCTSSISFATTAPGEFFKLKESGGKLPVSVTANLCLNGVKKLSCQKYTVSHTNLSITTIPNHVYPIAGITHNTSGIHISGCTPHSNGFCIFSVSNTQSTTVSATPTLARPVTVVGFYTKNGRVTPLSYYNNNNGQTWTVSLPPIQGSGNSQLYGVACDNTGQICTAVGYYLPNANGAPLSYYSRNGGQTWAPSFPQALGSGVSDILTNVACDSTGQRCTAVGYYTNATSIFPLTYFSSNGGKTWTISFPPLQGSGFSALFGVTCDSTGQTCTAVGYYNDSLASLSYYSNNGGKSWTVSFPQPQGSGQNKLINVACDSTGQICTAVGFFDLNNTQTPLSYYSKDGGKSWTPSIPQFQGFGNSTLLDVACDSTGQICTAVGYYTTKNNTKAPLTYFSSDGGKTWTASLPPLQGSGDSELDGVTCDSKGQTCTAVGYYTTNKRYPLSYYSYDSGNTWTPSFPPPQGSGDIGLYGAA